jgi:hypothetical protein
MMGVAWLIIGVSLFTSALILGQIIKLSVNLSGTGFRVPEFSIYSFQVPLVCKMQNAKLSERKCKMQSFQREKAKCKMQSFQREKDFIQHRFSRPGRSDVG